MNGHTEDPADFYARLPATRGAAGALIRADDDTILLVERVYAPHRPWVLPGGIIEADESPLSACRRELREELGIEPVIEHLAAVDWMPPHPPRTASVQWLFTAASPADSPIHLPPEELRAYAWVHPTHLADFLPRHCVRRITAALAASDTKTTVYLEYGYPIL